MNQSDLWQRIANTYCFPTHGDTTEVGPRGIPSYIPGIHLLWSNAHTPRNPFIYGAGILILGQGYKVAQIGDRSFRYDSENYLLMSVPLPLECETFATADEPLMGMFIEFDALRIRDIGAQMNLHQQGKPQFTDVSPRGVEIINPNQNLENIIGRLLECLCCEEKSRILGEPIINEIIYNVMKNEQQGGLYHLTQYTSHYARVASILQRFQHECVSPIMLEDFAEEVGASLSSVHRVFKEITAESPIQYIKKVRLNKAKEMILTTDCQMHEVATAVGYTGLSQFSREFKRYFDKPPTAFKKK